MRLNKIFTILSAVAVLMSTSSCKDFLDTVPDTRVDLNSVEKARMLMCAAYPDCNPMITAELTSDNVEDNNTQDSDGNRFNLSTYKVYDDEIFAFEEVKSGSDNDSPSGLWSTYYESIANCNAALECLDALQKKIDAGETVADAENLQAVRGEALMLRAFSMFMLVNHFCEAYRGPELSKNIVGLPYPTTPETTVKPHYERPDLAYDYEMMEKDITEGLPLISNAIYDVPKYHFNVAAANAFAARFYLWKRDYPKVIEYCNVALGGEQSDISRYVSDIWSHGTELYSPSDKGLYMQAMERQRNLMLVPVYSTGRRRFTGSHRYAPTRDARRATMQGPGPTWMSFSYRNTQTNEKYSANPCFSGFLYTNGKTQYGIWFCGNCSEQFEYTNKVAGIGYAHMTRSEFTGEEVIFMRAEAKMFLGDVEGAIDDLRVWELSLRNCPGAVGNENRYIDLTYNAIRAFYADSDPGYGIVRPIHIDEVYPCEYAVTEYTLPVLQCIQHFRRISMVHTGMRFLDLKRYGIEWSHKIGPENRIETMTLWDKRRAIQIPSEVIAAGFTPNLRPEPDTPSTTSMEIFVPAN